MVDVAKPLLIASSHPLTFFGLCFPFHSIVVLYEFGLGLISFIFRFYGLV